MANDNASSVVRDHSLSDPLSLRWIHPKKVIPGGDDDTRRSSPQGSQQKRHGGARILSCSPARFARFTHWINIPGCGYCCVGLGDTIWLRLSQRDAVISPGQFRSTACRPFKMVKGPNEDVYSKHSPQLRGDLSHCCVTIFRMVLGVCK